MKPQQLFPALFLLAMIFLALPARAQTVHTLTKRIVRPNTPQNVHLVNAVQAGNLAAVQAALQSGASADTEIGWEGQPQMTPVALLSSVSSFIGRQRSPAIFRLLVQHLTASSAADPKTGFALLSAAVELDDLDSVECLVCKGADVNTQAPRQSDVLHQSIEQNVSQKTLSPITAFLLDHGAKVDAVNPASQTALMQAADAGDYAVTALLLTYHAEINRRDK